MNLSITIVTQHYPCTELHLVSNEKKLSMSGYTVTYNNKKRLLRWEASITYNSDWFCNIYFMLSSYIKRTLFPWHLKTRQHRRVFTPLSVRNKHERDKTLAHPFRCLEKAEIVGQVVSHSGVTGKAIQVSLAKGEHVPPGAVINVTWKGEQTAVPRNRSIAHPWLALSLSQQLSPCPPAAPPSTSALRDHPHRLSPAHHFRVLEYSVITAQVDASSRLSRRCEKPSGTDVPCPKLWVREELFRSKVTRSTESPVLWLESQGTRECEECGLSEAVKTETSGFRTERWSWGCGRFVPGVFRNQGLSQMKTLYERIYEIHVKCIFILKMHSSKISAGYSG